MKGIQCGLTEQKPDFDTKCPVKKFEEGMRKEIESRNVTVRLIERTRRDVYFSIAVYMVVGLAILGADYYLTTLAWEYGLFDGVTIILAAVGFGVFGYAFAPFNKFRRSLNVAKRRKQQMDDVLAIYRIRYDIVIDVRDGYHGPEVSTRLDLTQPR